MSYSQTRLTTLCLHCTAAAQHTHATTCSMHVRNYAPVFVLRIIALSIQALELGFLAT